MIECWWF